MEPIGGYTKGGAYEGEGNIPSICSVTMCCAGVGGGIWVILVNMVMSVILGHEKTKIQNILDLGKIDIFSDRTNIYIKNKKMGHLI